MVRRETRTDARTDRVGLRKDRGLNTRRFGRINLGAKFLQSVSDDR